MTTYIFSNLEKQQFHSIEAANILDADKIYVAAGNHLMKAIVSIGPFTKFQAHPVIVNESYTDKYGHHEVFLNKIQYDEYVDGTFIKLCNQFVSIDSITTL